MKVRRYDAEVLHMKFKMRPGWEDARGVFVLVTDDGAEVSCWRNRLLRCSSLCAAAEFTEHVCDEDCWAECEDSGRFCVHQRCMKWSPDLDDDGLLAAEVRR